MCSELGRQDLTVRDQLRLLRAWFRPRPHRPVEPAPTAGLPDASPSKAAGTVSV